MLIALGILLLFPSQIRWRKMSLFLVLSVLAVHYRHGLPIPRNMGATYALYQKNLFFRIKDIGPVAEDIRSFRRLDFVTLQEITDAKRGLMAELKADFPYQHICPFSSVGGTAILSRLPIVEGSQKCFDGGGMSIAQINDLPEPVWVVSTHLNWPFPYSQRRQIDRLLPRLAELDGKVIIGGDFNNVPWSYTVRSFERASQTRRLPGTLSTFHVRIFGTPIDHVLGPQRCTGKTKRRPKLGSDHHGVYAQIACDQKPD